MCVTVAYAEDLGARMMGAGLARGCKLVGFRDFNGSDTGKGVDRLRWIQLIGNRESGAACETGTRIPLRSCQSSTSSAHAISAPYRSRDVTGQPTFPTLLSGNEDHGVTVPAISSMYFPYKNLPVGCRKARGQDCSGLEA